MSVETQAQLLEVARKYADYLVESAEQPAGRLHWNITPCPPGHVLQWGNPENIDSGVSGVVLFLLELYKQTGAHRYLTLADRVLENMLVHCKNNPTHNYGLYSGRGGVIYVLIQRYLLGKDDRLLAEALLLIAPANQYYLYSRYTSDYLYDGRAGTLLLLLHLYHLSKADFLPEYINQFTRTIIANASLGPNGVSWRAEEETNVRDSCGFSRGAAGIRYVLGQLHQCCPAPELTAVLRDTDCFIDSCWEEQAAGWPDSVRDILSEETLNQYKQAYLLGEAHLLTPNADFFWAHGTPGVVYAREEAEPTRQERINNRLHGIVAAGRFANGSLYNGAAGLGMYFLDQQAGEGHTRWQALTDQLAQELLPEPDPVALDGGLMHGHLGQLYFCLKAFDFRKGDENILKPFAGSLPEADFTLRLAPSRRDLLARHYPRTVALMESLMPQLLTQHTEMSTGSFTRLIPAFNAFIETLPPAKVPAFLHPRLLDLFQLEKTKLAFRQLHRKSSLETYLAGLCLQDQMTSALNRPSAWLLDQTLSISRSVKIARSKWEWSHEDAPEQSGPKATRYTAVPPGNFEYILQVSGKLETAEFFLTQDKQLLFHCFDQPKTVRQAMSEIQHTIRSLPAGMLQELIFGLSKSHDTTDFLNHLDNIILYRLREWLYRGILVLVKPQRQLIV